MATVRREPQRTCIGCREAAGKRALTRLVRVAGGGVAIEGRGKRLAGRGAYLHARRSCWERALQGATIREALRLSPNGGDLEGLRRYLETMAESGGGEA